MTQHNIIGSERAGPHFVIRRMKAPHRRTFADQVLSAIGGLVVLICALAGLFTLIIWSGIA